MYLLELEVGATPLAILGPWPGSMFLIECERAREQFVLTVINTGQGVEYHECDPDAFPHPKYHTVMRLSGIPGNRLVNPATLWFLLHIYTRTAKGENYKGPGGTPDRKGQEDYIYNIFLPHLLPANGIGQRRHFEPEAIPAEQTQVRRRPQMNEPKP
jgi:hypothetical protein